MFRSSGSYGGGWVSQYNDKMQFLQIDLGHVAMVTGVATQGNDLSAYWVTKYTLDYGIEDGNFTTYNNGQVSERFEKSTESKGFNI